MATSNPAVMTLFSDAVDLASHQVRLVIAEKNLNCRVMDVDPLDLSDDVMDLNPYGSLPTFADRELALYDAHIICEYLDERFPQPSLMPSDPVSRATMRLYRYRIQRDWIAPAEMILSNGSGAVEARKGLSESLTASAPIFNAKAFFMNDVHSLLDTDLAPLLWRLPLLKLPLSSAVLQQIDHYAKRLFIRSGFIKSLTQAEQDMRQELSL